MSVSDKAAKIVISGYYGFDNCGDEAVLLSIIHCLKKLSPEVKITVLSANPENTRELYGVNAVNRWNPVVAGLELLRADLLISGGGSLIQDVTSARSPRYYLGIIKMALLLRKKVMIYSQGVGPLLHEQNRASTSKIFSRCHAITLRDSSSAKLLEEIGVTKKIKVTCDPVLALGRENVCTGITAELLLELGISGKDGKKEKPLLFVSVRNWKSGSHFKPIAEALDAVAADGWNVLLVPAHFPEDAEASRTVLSLMSSKPLFIDRCLTAREFLALTSIADKVLSMRLHGLICAMAAGTPMVGISYDPKVDAFMEQAQMAENCLPYDDPQLKNEVLKRLGLPQANSASPASLPPDFERRRRELSQLAWDSAKIAINLTK